MHELARVAHEVADRFDLLRGPAAGVLDAVEHERDPWRPALLRRHLEQQAVVVGLVADDVAAQVQNRRVEQPLLHEIENVEDAARAAVAVGERMDRLELIVLHGAANQRIEVVLRREELLPVRELVADHVLADGRRVDHGARRRVAQRRAGFRAQIERLVLDRAAHLDRRLDREPALLHLAHAFEQRAPITQRFFRRGIRGARLGRVDVLEQLVGRRHDVFDLGARLRFEQRQRVHEHRGVRNQLRGLLELRERNASADALLQDGRRLDALERGWQRRQIVERNRRIERHRYETSLSSTYRQRHVDAIDRSTTICRKYTTNFDISGRFVDQIDTSASICRKIA